MDDQHEADAEESKESTLYDSLRTRWYVAAIAAVIIFGCLAFAVSAQGREIFNSIVGLLGGGSGTSEPQGVATQAAPLPPTDTPSPTATESPEGDASTPTTAAIGDGACNARCDPAASNCLAGLSCLPVPGADFSVCWNSTICSSSASTTGAPTPTGNPGVTGTPVTSGCGNGVCDPGEHVYNCPQDCGQPPPNCGACGDGNTSYCLVNACGGMGCGAPKDCTMVTPRDACGNPCGSDYFDHCGCP